MHSSYVLQKYDKFCDGSIQQDSSEHLWMPREIIHRAQCLILVQIIISRRLLHMFFFFIFVSFRKFFHFCDTCGLRFDSFESSCVLYITPNKRPSMRKLRMQDMQQKSQKTCCRCKKNTWLIESNHILQTTKYLIIIVNLSIYKNNNFTKSTCIILMDMNITLPTVAKKNIILQRW